MTIGLPAAMPSSYEIKVPKPYGFGTFQLVEKVHQMLGFF